MLSLLARSTHNNHISWEFLRNLFKDRINQEEFRTRILYKTPLKFILFLLPLPALRGAQARLFWKLFMILFPDHRVEHELNSLNSLPIPHFSRLLSCEICSYSFRRPSLCISLAICKGWVSPIFFLDLLWNSYHTSWAHYSSDCLWWVIPYNHCKPF